jgi:ectoine hydroxylase-related dioxygenase (phytanoyl-CoA dioxygenase family)
VAGTCAHPRVLRQVEALIGGPVKRPNRNRGAYVNFPRSVEGQLGPHNDTMPAELFGMVYLDGVGPLSGGTTIWPGSHLELWPCVDTEHRCGFCPNARYSPTFGRIVRTVQPVEFVGGIGDVLFLHPLMIHSAGINSARRGGGTLRIAAVCEWQLGAASVASFVAAGPAEIYLCNVYSCHEILKRHGRG